jgi:type II secretory pathway component PulC
MALELPKFSKKEKSVVPMREKSVILKISQFFEKNPWMKIVIPVILFLILVAVFLLVMFGDGILSGKDNVDTNDTSTQSNEVQVIPGNNIIKDKELVELINNDPLSPDILSSAKYTGSVTGSSGLKTALIQVGSNNEVLVLSIGETVGDSDWELKEIYADYVIFRAGDTTKKINLS